MPRAGEQIDSDVVRYLQIARAVGVGGVEREQSLRILGIRVGVEDLRAALGLAAALELAAGDSRDPVMAHVPGLRRLRTRVLSLGMLRSRQSVGLPKSDIERTAVRCFVRDCSF